MKFINFNYNLAKSIKGREYGNDYAKRKSSEFEWQ